MNAKQEMPETMRSKEQTYFQTLIELAPNEIWEIGKEKIHYTDFVDIERVKELKNDLDNEIWHFRSYLMGINQHDRITVIEYTILELLTPYAITRRAMKQLPDQERDKGRATMLLLYNVISRIIWLTKKELKLSFTADFTEYWERAQWSKLFFELNEPKKEAISKHPTKHDNKESNTIEIEQAKKPQRKPGRPKAVIHEASFYLKNKKLLQFLIDNYSNVEPKVFNQLLSALADIEINQLKPATKKEYKVAFGKALNVKQKQSNFDNYFNTIKIYEIFEPIKATIKTYLNGN